MRDALPIAAESARRPSSIPAPDPWAMTLKHASVATGVGLTSLKELIRDGKLKSCKVAGRRLIYTDSLRQLMFGPAD